MKQVLALISSLLIVDSFPSYCTAAQARTTEYTACAVQVRVPPDDHVYSDLATARDHKIHLTCPINVMKQSTTMIYVLHGGDECGHAKLFGYQVLSRKLLTEADAKQKYGQCSGIIHLKNQIKALAPAITYSWYVARTKESDRRRVMDSIFPKLMGRLASSGFPILNFDNLNNIFCFEIDARYHKTPLEMARMIGIDVPPSIHQVRYSNMSCEKLFHQQ